MAVQGTDRSSSDYNPFDAINAAAQGNSTRKSSASQDLQTRFLNLLITQLQNQDPLNPVDNAQLTSQLAQLSTVSGVEKLNETLNALVSDVGASQSMQASVMVGKNVLVPGSRTLLINGTAVGGVNLSGKADSVVINIMNADGKVVYTRDLGAHDEGVLNFVWDGKLADGSSAPNGTYKFSVEAQQDGKGVSTTALQVGTVSALVRSGKDFLLDLGDLGRMDFKSVYQIL